MVGIANWQSQQGMQAGDTPWLLQGANTAIQSGLQGVNRGINNLTGELQKQQNSSALGQLLSGANTAQAIRDKISQNPNLFNQLNPDGQRLLLNQQTALSDENLRDSQANKYNADTEGTKLLNSYIPTDKQWQYKNMASEIDLRGHQGREADASANNMNSMASARAFGMRQAMDDRNGRIALGLAGLQNTGLDAPIGNQDSRIADSLNTPIEESHPDSVVRTQHSAPAPLSLGSMGQVQPTNDFSHVFGIGNVPVHEQNFVIPNYPGIPEGYVHGSENNGISDQELASGMLNKSINPPPGYSKPTPANIDGFVTHFNNILNAAPEDTANAAKARQYVALLQKHPQWIISMSPEQRQLVQDYYTDNHAIPQKQLSLDDGADAWVPLNKDNQSSVDRLTDIRRQRQEISPGIKNYIAYDAAIRRAGTSTNSDEQFAKEYGLNPTDLAVARARVREASADKNSPYHGYNDTKFESLARMYSVAKHMQDADGTGKWPNQANMDALEAVSPTSQQNRSDIINKMRRLQNIEKALYGISALSNDINGRINTFGQNALINPNKRHAFNQGIEARGALVDEGSNIIGELQDELTGRRSPNGVSSLITNGIDPVTDNDRVLLNNPAIQRAYGMR